MDPTPAQNAVRTIAATAVAEADQKLTTHRPPGPVAGPYGEDSNCTEV
jgi:hypothetical protein